MFLSQPTGLFLKLNLISPKMRTKLHYSLVDIFGPVRTPWRHLVINLTPHATPSQATEASATQPHHNNNVVFLCIHHVNQKYK